MKHITLILIILLNVSVSVAQRIDSIYTIATDNYYNGHYEQFVQLNSKNAIPYFECAYQLFNRFENRSEEPILSYRLTCLNNLLESYILYSMYIKAESCISQLIDIYQKELDTLNYSYVFLLVSAAEFYENVDKLNQALIFYKKALLLYSELTSIDTISFPELEALPIRIGHICKKNGYYDEAEKYLFKAIENVDHSIKPHEIFCAYKDLGDIYFETQRYDLAKSQYDLAMNVSYTPYEPALLEKMGEIYCLQDSLQKAELYLEKIHPILDDGYNASSLIFSIGQLCEKHGYVEKAKKYYSMYIEHIKLYIFDRLAIYPETYREQYWEEYTAKYIHPVLSFFLKEKSKDSPKHLYNIALFVKAHLLFQHQIFHNAIMSSTDSMLVKSRNRFFFLQEQLNKEKQKNNQIDRVYVKRLEQESLYTEKELLDNIWGEREKSFSQLKNNNCESIKNKLSDSEYAIEFIYNQDSVCALLLHCTYNVPELIPLFEEKEVLEYSTKEIDGKPATNLIYSYNINEGDTIGYAKKLFDLVWSKILPKIKEGETIYFAPSGLLHQLAIEHLPYDETRTMADVFNMVRLSSTREIVINKPQSQYASATVYGGIAYNVEEDILLAESSQYEAEHLHASRSIDNDTLNRGSVKYLPGTRKEAEHINTLLVNHNISAKLYTTTKANEESFKALSGKHNNILHIGTHGFTWTDSVAKKQDFFTQRVRLMGQEQHYNASIDPLNRCGLLFAGANIALQGNSKDLPEGVQDGILTAKEISLLDLRDADLVVLSACETAKGDITSEGVFGLQRAFKMAGVQTIIMSLWKVNDQATQLLMTEFYNNWIGKQQSKCEAFRNAQNTIRSQYKEPVYWAGFVMLD